MLEKCKSLFAMLRSLPGRVKAFYLAHWPVILSWVLFAATPLFCFWMVEYLSDNQLTRLEPWQWVMNLVWYSCVLFLGWLITGRQKGAIWFTGLTSFGLGLANHYVLRFRGRALFPIDLLGWKTAANVADGYDYSLDENTWIAILALCALLGLALFLPKQKRNFGRRWVKWLNLGLAAGWSVYIVLFFFTPMLPTLGVYAQQWKTWGNGLLLNFTVSARYMRVEKPDGYSDEAARALIEQLESEGYSSDSASDSDTVVNFICIMDESFADLTRFDSLTLSEDPTPFYHSLTENTIKGQMVSPVTGGGTASVEFEALTGCNMTYLPSGTVAYQLYLTERTPSLAQIAKALNVRSSAYHPYKSSGWNRITAYDRLGFKSQYYEDNTVDGTDITTDYTDMERKRGFVSDSADFERLYQLTDAAKEAGEDCFVFNVTMQNHSGYDRSWTNLRAAATLTGDYKGKSYNSTTNQYLALASATDSALEELITHYSAVEEPTVILFFGDHQPPLSNDLYRDIYGKALDERDDEELLEQYVTPFFIWANFDIEEQDDVLIGASFLGNLASQVAGYPQTGWMKFLEHVNDSFDSVTRIGYAMADGRVLGDGDEDQLSEEEQELLRQYETLQYYLLFGDSAEESFFFVGE